MPLFGNSAASWFEYTKLCSNTHSLDIWCRLKRLGARTTFALLVGNGHSRLSKDPSAEDICLFCFLLCTNAGSDINPTSSSCTDASSFARDKCAESCVSVGVLWGSSNSGDRNRDVELAIETLGNVTSCTFWSGFICNNESDWGAAEELLFSVDSPCERKCEAEESNRIGDWIAATLATLIFPVESRSLRLLVRIDSWPTPEKARNKQMSRLCWGCTLHLSFRPWQKWFASGIGPILRIRNQELANKKVLRSFSRKSEINGIDRPLLQ